MPGTVVPVQNDSEFQPHLTNAGNKLVVVDFFATWCGPCNRIAPGFESLAAKYTNAVFLKVDVDKCEATAATYQVTAMPTFILFKGGVKIDVLRGADINGLEDKIKKYYNVAEDDDDGAVKGHMDLISMINKQGSECLNESDEHPLDHCLTAEGGYLESDCDEQLIISLAFNQPVKIHSLKMQGPAGKSPKFVKLFINQPRTLDFDSAESMSPVQKLEFTSDDSEAGTPQQLRYVKFQNVQNITIFVMDNHGGEDVTRIDHLALFGTPVSATNMADFKRVAGKKGESH